MTIRFKATVNKKTSTPLTVAQLIELLQKQDPTLPVMVRSEAGEDLCIIGASGSSKYEPTAETDEVLYLTTDPTV